ncbi:hypothetical protein QN277_028249 [Acacia crassicarpa]|uniref:UBX domain-containing protein n=1 Tax=Acacia crassicarpa TaxID=499986 RepID=A0AAE1J645_9FABA|nr:hypothetical protein QN277_028249 [Acacia crassicarpa]
MAKPEQEAIETFMSVTGVSEAIAVLKLKKHLGDVNDAVNEHFNEGDRNVARNHCPSSIHDSTIGRNRFDALSGPTNQLLGGSDRPIAPSSENLSNGRDDTDEQTMRAVMESSRLEFERSSRSQEQRDIERAISLSIETDKQERAQRMQGDVRAPIVRPPESSVVELGKITASNGRFQAESSFLQDEAENAREQPLIRKRPRSIFLSSQDLAENAHVIETSTMSSSGNRDSNNKRQHTRNAIHEEEELERRLAAKEAALPPEPSSEDENAVTLLVKMPDGRRRGRRFLKSDNLQFLFDFIDIGRKLKTGTYKLVRPYPRRVFSDGEGALTLNEVGVTNKQEVLYLELI